MPKFALIGTIEIASGRTEEFVPLLIAHRARCRQDEPGTLRFDVLLPREGTTKVMLYEFATKLHSTRTGTAHPWHASEKRPPEMITAVSSTRCDLVE